MKQFSEETRRRMSESAKRRCSDPKWLEAQHNRGTKLPLDKVKEMYADGHTQAEIAEALGVSQKVVWRFMKNHGIKARVAAKRDQEGEKNSTWRGGIVEDGSGYILARAEGHPRAKKQGKYVREHILVAEKNLGRSLLPCEVVHHINGIKNDNRPENLAVMTSSAHLQYHAKARRGEDIPLPIAVTSRRFNDE
jgi:predicted DNA-binding protein (UPF0251 family)